MNSKFGIPLETEEDQIKAIEMDYTFFKYIINPTDYIKHKAVEICSLALKYIKDMNYDFYFKFVKMYGYTLQYVPKELIDEKMIAQAIETDGCAIKYVKNPSFELIEKAILQTGLAYCQLKKPSQYFIDMGKARWECEWKEIPFDYEQWKKDYNDTEYEPEQIAIFQTGSLF